jgi:hypothetical protein
MEQGFSNSEKPCSLPVGVLRDEKGKLENLGGAACVTPLKGLGSILIVSR